MLNRSHRLPWVLLLSWLMAGIVGAETTRIPAAEGAYLTVEIHRGADFEAGQEVSIIVGPGDVYWSDLSPPAGWVVVTGEPFFGAQRLQHSKLALDWLRRHFKVRHGGFHITGWSANSAGVFEIAMAYPDEFLSVTGIAGMPARGSEADLNELVGTRVQFIVGEKDTYWRRGSEDWHRKMQQLGIRSTLEIIPGGGHVMPEIANEPLFERFRRLVDAIESTASRGPDDPQKPPPG